MGTVIGRVTDKPSRMHSLAILLLLCGLLGSGLALTCWNSVGFKALRDTNVITMLECPETMSQSCFKKWYRVTSWGDHYYSLGCSDAEPQPETVFRRGFSGEYGDYFCSGDYCNSSGRVGAIAALTIVTVLALSHSTFYFYGPVPVTYIFESMT